LITPTRGIYNSVTKVSDQTGHEETECIIPEFVKNHEDHRKAKNHWTARSATKLSHYRKCSLCRTREVFNFLCFTTTMQP
jgi:hypothetical protein